MLYCDYGKYNNCEMKITKIDNNIDINDNDYKPNTTKCYFCNNTKKLYKTYYNEKFVDACFLCNMIVNYKKEYLFFASIGKTNMTQIDIINKTWKLYEKNKTIPLPKEIDDKVEFVKIPVYIYSEFKEIDKKDDYVLFFTNKVDKFISEEFDNCENIFGNGKKVKNDFLSYIKY